MPNTACAASVICDVRCNYTVMECNYPTNRVREKTVEEASKLADVDSRRDPKEFIREIYKEAYNNQQDGHDQVSKVLMKCSALFVRLTADLESVHRSIRRWTILLFVPTAAVVVLTIALVYYTAKLVQHEEKPAQHDNQSITNDKQPIMRTN